MMNRARLWPARSLQIHRSLRRHRNPLQSLRPNLRLSPHRNRHRSRSLILSRNLSRRLHRNLRRFPRQSRRRNRHRSLRPRLRQVRRMWDGRRILCKDCFEVIKRVRVYTRARFWAKSISPYRKLREGTKYGGRGCIVDGFGIILTQKGVESKSGNNIDSKAENDERKVACAV